MVKYKTLDEMKIKNPLEIARYSVQSVEHGSSYVDILRIIYKGKKGSFLPQSERYRFHRIKKTDVAKSGTHKVNIRWEISPILQKAISELDQIVSSRLSREESIHIILDEMKRLEEDAKIRIDYIRSMIKSILNEL